MKINRKITRDAFEQSWSIHVDIQTQSIAIFKISLALHAPGMWEFKGTPEPPSKGHLVSITFFFFSDQIRTYKKNFYQVTFWML